MKHINDNETGGGYSPSGIKRDVVPLLKNRALHIFIVLVAVAMAVNHFAGS